MTTPFLLGVNYWPRRKAMGWWARFDLGEVREEFALIRDLGLKLVRIFLLWDDFQPDPDSVSAPALAHLVQVADTAAELGLALDITFFTGHMSGPNWPPRWLMGTPAVATPRPLARGGRLITGTYRNPFSDPEALAAERRLLTAVITALREHPAVAVWNLGNEPDLFAEPADAAAGQAWVRAWAAHVRALDPAHPVTCGLHFPSLASHNGLRVDQVFSATDWAVMHAYPMYLPWAREPLDPEVVPFACALASALCGRPVLMEEFGGPTLPPGTASQVRTWTAHGRPHRQFLASEDDLAAYLAAVLPRLVDVGATGAVLWCFADYAEALWNEPPCDEFWHERHFGLVRPDGTLKPHAQVLRGFAAAHPQVRAAPARRVTLDLTPDEYYQDPDGNAQRLFQRFVAGAG
ncbi:MAG: hypothetical protein KA764_06905 [Anaerolineales bacterium]|nr:hypothetical protein [Anaerolineales bacterium]